MEEKLVLYIRRHTMTVTLVVVLGFLLLGLGEYYLYRKVMFVNQMVSEGLMQIKEEVKTPTSTPLPTTVTPTPPMMKQAK